MAKKNIVLDLKDGVEVKTLEELRENFDLEKVVAHFKEGTLLEWLEYHFYDDEAEAIESIEVDDRNAPQKICAALNVECDEDLEFTQRIREKKAILSEKTDDQTIIENATTTAMNQDDLANLLHMDYKKIYLCGEQFNVPIRMTDMNYIGILGTPKIKIKATSDEELAEKNIIFENCKLPWTKESPIEQYKALAARIFGTNGEWQIVDENNKIISSYDKLSETEKKMAINLCCQGKYKESDIVYMMIRDDLSDGFAFTIDSFCTGGATGGHIVKYKSIIAVSLTSYGTPIIKSSKEELELYGGMLEDNRYLNYKIKKFLDVVKNI